MCSAAVQIIWSRLDCSPAPRVARSALAVEHAQFHWALAQITNHKKQRSGGLGLEREVEPAAAWWSNHSPLVLWWGSFLKLLMLVVGGWCLGQWVEQQWRHCSLRFLGLSLVSMSLCGVYAGWLEPSETWDVELEETQHRTQGPEGLLAFCFHPGDENRLAFLLLFVSTHKVKWFVMLERGRVYFVTYEKCHDSAVQNEKVCMWKTNGLYVMLGTTRECLMFFLCSRSYPLHQLCKAMTRSRPSCLLWEDLFSFF